MNMRTVTRSMRRAQRQDRHVVTPAEHAAVMARIEAQAIADGRHSPIEQWRTLCDGCGRWVSGIYSTSLDRKRYCFSCVCGLPPQPSTLHAPSSTVGGQTHA